MCEVASHMPPTGDLAGNPGMFPDQESNLWPFILQADAQFTEPQQPGPLLFKNSFTECSHWRKQCGVTSKNKNKNITAYDLAIPPLGIYSKKPEILILKTICTPMFISALFAIAKIWKQPKCPSVDEWIKKLWYIYTVEYFKAIKRKELLLFVTVWIHMESIMLSEISQSEKGKYHTISLLCGT